MALETAINKLIEPFIKQIVPPYERINKFYYNLSPNDPLAGHYLKELQKLYSKKEQLLKMPAELIILAKQYGGIDKEPAKTLTLT